MGTCLFSASCISYYNHENRRSDSAENYGTNFEISNPVYIPTWINTVTSNDFNLDGNEDILLGGNFSGVPPMLGKYDASYGSMLLGNGKGSFTPMNLQESGFVVSGEIRNIKVFNSASGERCIIVARNNDTSKIFIQNMN